MTFSHADYLSMQARCKTRQSAPSSAVEDESELHEQILAECRRRGWLAFHGSMAHRSMRTIGECDFTILANSGRVLFIECKAKKGKLSTEQLGVQIWAEKLGHTIHVVYSFEDFMSVVRDHNL